QSLVELGAEPGHMYRPLGGTESPRRLVAPCRHPRRDLGDVIGAPRPCSPGLVSERLGEILEPRSGVTPQRHVRGAAPADLLRENVEVDQRYSLRRQRVALGGNLSELAADDDEAVRSFDQLVGDARITAEKSDRKRMGAGDAALAAHCMGDGDRLS